MEYSKIPNDQIGALIGKTIYKIVGTKARKNSKWVTAEVILFDDRKTFLMLEEQDYRDYHDCSSGAREITVLQCKNLWAMYDSEPRFGDATDLT